MSHNELQTKDHIPHTKMTTEGSLTNYSLGGLGRERRKRQTLFLSLINGKLFKIKLLF